MKRKPYCIFEKELLEKSQAILKVNNFSVTYNPEFKIFAVQEYLSGKSPTRIFADAGVNIGILGKKQPKKCLERWVKAFNTNGNGALMLESRGKNSTGRPLGTAKASVEDKIKKLELENAALKEEVTFLKKLRGWK